MTDPRIKMDVVRHTKPSSRVGSRRDVQQLQPISHNLQSHQHVWHDRNPQVPHQYHHHNLGAHQQFYSHEGLTRFNEYGRPSFVQSHPSSEVFHTSHHLQNAQNAQTFAQQEYNASSSIQECNIHNINNNHHHHHNSFIYGGVNVSHNYQQQSTFDPRNCNQQQSTHDPRDYIQQLPPPHGLLGFHNDHDSIQVLDRELRQLALIPGHATTSSETQEEVFFQKHSREHVKVMIELGNKKRIKHPGDDAVHEHKSSKTRKLSLEVISEHHPVHTKPTELQIKTLPISETLRRDATLGGYIFLCKDETMDLEIMNQLFVLPARYKDSVRAITPGTPLFLYNVTRHELHGVFEATSFGTYDTNPLSFLAASDNDKFPAHVACRIRKRYHALAEEEFRYALSHYDGPKFILQLSVPQVLDIITLFEEQQIPPQDRRHGPFSYCHRDPEG